MFSRSFGLSSLFFNCKKYISHSRFLHAFLKIFTYLFPLVISVRWLTSHSPHSYKIEDQISSSSMPIIFTRSESTNLSICLKLWKQYEDLCNIFDKEQRINHLLDGLKFNRNFAPGVYLGITPIHLEGNTKNLKEVLRGWLIKYPKKEVILQADVEYALVMRTLDRKWRLDYQLHKGKLDTQDGMEFLAREIARMHKKVVSMHKKRKDVPETLGTSESILSKLEGNIGLFERALDQLPEDQPDMDLYRSTSTLMAQVGKNYTELFDQRHRNGHIKRCHGDLKLTNLWLPEKRYLSFSNWKPGKRLFALDCVDFNLEFCHIDTLSDVAMLAIDIEAYLGYHSNAEKVEELTQHFLNCYISASKEDKDAAGPLLNYYMTEKAMVRASMCILYESLPLLGVRYLAVAANHASRLGQPQLSEKELASQEGK